MTRSGGGAARKVQESEQRCHQDEQRRHAPGERDLARHTRRSHTRVRIRFSEPPEIAHQVCNTLPAIIGILFDTAFDDVIQKRWGQRLNRGNCRWVGVHDGADETRVRLTLERFLAREHLVEHAAERKDVGPRVGLLTFELLGGHVLKRAQNGALRGDRGRRSPSEANVLRLRRRLALREAEVEQLRAGLRQHDVAGLEIAVHDARPWASSSASAISTRMPQRLGRAAARPASDVPPASRPRGTA